MIPMNANAQSLIQRLAGLEQRLRQHDVDLIRLWNNQVQNQQSPLFDGESQATSSSSGGGGSVIHEGHTTTAYSRAVGFDRKTNPGTVTVTEEVPDPSSTTNPIATMDATTGITVVIRSNVKKIASGTYIAWRERTLPDGSTENLYMGGDC